MKAVCSLVLWLLLCGLALASRVLPGNFHFQGRVIKKANGQYDVFNGVWCAKFPREKTAGLEAYLGKCVDVEFSEIADHRSDTGTSFGGIQRINIVEETPDNFPILVTAHPTKAVFDISEPIVVKVILENRSQVDQPLDGIASHAVLLRDYEKIIWLEPDDNSWPNRSNWFGAYPNTGKLAAGGQMVFTIESSRMAEPGEYDLSYVLSSAGRPGSSVSGFVPIKVTSPSDEARVAALQSWLKTAALEQRIEIANELAKMGNRGAIDEFMAQLKTGMYVGPGGFYVGAYRFAFEYGGVAGERLMLDLIEHEKFQEAAATFVGLACNSRHSANLLFRLLSSTHTLDINLQDWVAHPRICDITADMIMQRTGGKMQFPRTGSIADRDDAVARAQRALEDNPQTFRDLVRD